MIPERIIFVSRGITVLCTTRRSHQPSRLVQMTEGEKPKITRKTANFQTTAVIALDNWLNMPLHSEHF